MLIFCVFRPKALEQRNIRTWTRSSTKSLIPLPRRSRIQYDLKTQGCPGLYRGDRLLPLRRGNLMSEKRESMRNAQSRTDGTVQILQNGSIYEVICDIMHCSKRKVHQIAKTMRDPNYQECQHIHLPGSNKVPKKVTNGISPSSKRYHFWTQL
jgi:hypothetical protein